MVLLGFVIDGYDLQLETVESCPEQFALRIIDGSDELVLTIDDDRIDEQTIGEDAHCLAEEIDSDFLEECLLVANDLLPKGFEVRALGWLTTLVHYQDCSEQGLSNKYPTFSRSYVDTTGCADVLDYVDKHSLRKTHPDLYNSYFRGVC